MGNCHIIITPIKILTVEDFACAFNVAGLGAVVRVACRIIVRAGSAFVSHILLHMPHTLIITIPDLISGLAVLGRGIAVIHVDSGAVGGVN